MDKKNIATFVESMTGSGELSTTKIAIAIGATAALSTLVYFIRSRKRKVEISSQETFIKNRNSSWLSLAGISKVTSGAAVSRDDLAMNQML